MDLSAIIFVVLALAWAVYLIPKALKHHDELASDRLVEGHSDKVRILRRRSSAGQAEVVEVEVEHTDTVQKSTRVQPVAARPVLTRASARQAAQRRRRVLGVLLLVLAVVWGLDWFAYVPFWSPVVPGLLVVAWLVLARRSVRRQVSARQHGARQRTATVTTVEPSHTSTSPVSVGAASESQDLVDLLAEDTVGLQRQEIEAALADDGSLWDPLPLTLPTYVNKARARRTVRTIELTGINSSGHDRADTDLARQAAENDEASKDAGSAERKVAGA